MLLASDRSRFDDPRCGISNTLIDLYQCWLDIVMAHAGETALTELATKRCWTFEELRRGTESLPCESSATMAFPSGRGVEFIFAMLRAWRNAKVTCPLEPGAMPPRIPAPPHSVVHLKITSGSTGATKCIAFTAEQLVADVEAIVKGMGMGLDTINLGVISLAHSYGFSNLVLPLFLHGIPLILAPNPLPGSIVEAVRFAGPARLTIPAVPAMWRAWHEVHALPPQGTLAISAGAALAETLESAIFAASGLKIHNFVGASECGGILFDSSSTPRPATGFAGRPLPGVEILRDTDGCLEIRSGAVAETYWPNPDPSLGHGTYRSRDLVEISPEGGVSLKGRADDLINIAGRKVAPEAIEIVLRRHPAVRECLVLGVPDASYRGESVVAVVELTEPRSESDLRDFVRATLPEWQTPKIWQFVSQLNPGERGKFSRAEWRERISTRTGMFRDGAN